MEYEAKDFKEARCVAIAMSLQNPRKQYVIIRQKKKFYVGLVKGRLLRVIANGKEK